MKIKTILLSTLALAACVTLSAQDKMVPFKTTLPKPKLAGTPVAIRVPHLETAADIDARKPVKVPEGSKNLALEKPVTSSDSMPIIGMLEQITDGDKDSDEGCFVELGDGKQWVQIDLEKAHKIYAIALWHFHSQERAYHDVIVQISNDADFLTGVTTVFNNDHDNSSGLGKGADKAYTDTSRGRVLPVDGVSGRYVRLYSKGNTANAANHYIEVEVWGK
ncbi:discoidin domain-containing protein [Ereboglobus luteus]|uniref:F5/8 type C domain-containing protein n=1 Tax=Ereboglobus luteus TaxID=1796921 RepID=A0A2U8E4Q9_9BACT|nr:discoidin domain-containing protein [Ereboglobus luteus]AWI09909.1 hypothetical protein CKA38_12200 [Ereboglobus luteus]